MTGSPAALQDVRKYDGEQHIQIADGNTLPVTAIGNLGSSFTNVFVSPTLSANLISVGQLVEENFSLHFDRSGCRVQDQASGLEIAKGPKVGRLFPLQSFSIPRSISVGYSAIANNSHFWHKKLGHPNSVILTHLMKHGHLSNTNVFSSLSFDCAPCKLGKSKSLPFPLQGSRASTCFEIIHSDVWGMSPVLSHAQYSTPTRFRPSIVYQRRRPLPLPSSEPLHNSVVHEPHSSEPPFDHVVHEPHRSTRVSRPPDWYGFSTSAFQATLDTTFVPKSYSQASTQECWRQAM
ncbi:hypothetical protein LWI29_035504 [Acer saccharum]|uniref:GAG-pre-integrase domain-containing protein n=1 Tax=Acer saccharum TaxID=4024 RepID=A0AA39S5F4_ACESA|nr:hypothetical protein LWI29_035504 [Acer saccharum]